ncbi:aldo/keto reductase [Actinoallomurus bryophytorum]|uniref:aldo/keto reductase n=1 Tax=Actinoallomurus bryophytorum TaxID=1490222 RepID=UPI001C8903C8|nr:aldo/keto reductase [Actinoallomurus bryophytorum]
MATPTCSTKPTPTATAPFTDEVGAIAGARAVTRAQVALAWLHRNPVAAAPLVGARTIQQIDDAVASLDLEITDEEARRLETPYTPRHDLQGISDARELERIKAGIPGFANL